MYILYLGGKITNCLQIKNFSISQLNEAWSVHHVHGVIYLCNWNNLQTAHAICLIKITFFRNSMNLYNQEKCYFYQLKKKGFLFSKTYI